MTFAKLLQSTHHALKRIMRLGRSPVNADISIESNTLNAYRCFDGGLESLVPRERVADIPLSESWLQSPGFVEVAGQVFDLRKDGVYRFYQLPMVSEQRVVWNGDPEAVLKFIGYLIGYGDDDDTKDTSHLRKKLTNARVIGGCGTLAKLVQNLLLEIGIESRIILFMAASDWGGQDDGHTLLELRNKDKEWFLYDPSFGNCFVFNERRVSALDFSVIRSQHFVIERQSTGTGYTRFSRTNYDYDFWIAERFLSDTSLTNWYRRVCALPILSDRGGLYCCESAAMKGDFNKISRHFNIISEDEFRARFY